MQSHTEPDDTGCNGEPLNETECDAVQPRVLLSVFDGNSWKDIYDDGTVQQGCE